VSEGSAYAQENDGRAARWMAEGAASLSDPDGIIVVIASARWK